MVEQRASHLRARVALAVSAVLMLGAPANGQGPFPPVPGPFPVMPGTGFAAQMPRPIAPAILERPERAETTARPLFQPPANAMRLPYWMQAPVAGDALARDVETDAVATTETPARTATASARQPATARTTVPQRPAAPGFAQPMPSWTVPNYGAQGYGPQGYGAQGYGMAPGYAAPHGQVTGGANGAAPGTAWGVPQQPMQPGWGYGAAPGWGPAPQAFVPGWGWGAPAPGAGQ